MAARSGCVLALLSSGLGGGASGEVGIGKVTQAAMGSEAEGVSVVSEV
jgi:hypothetical protein